MKPWHFKAFSVPKELSSPRDNEDAYSMSPRCSATRSLALADGASRALGADAWARLLVRAHARKASGSSPGQMLSRSADEAGIDREGLTSELEKWLLPLSSRWRRYESWRLGPRVKHWSVHNKLLAGSYATLLVVSLEPYQTGGCRWSALAVGDTCLFIVEKDALVVRFPLQEAEAFNARPAMFGTRSFIDEGVQRWRQELRVSTGEAISGSWIFAMTDALGKWFLTRSAEGVRPWEHLLRLNTEAEFSRWVVAARELHELETDDTTIIFGQV